MRHLYYPLAGVVLIATSLFSTVAVGQEKTLRIDPPPAAAAAVVAPVAAAAPAGNAALFVGVDTFADPSLSPLKYAADDAVAQAHLFSVEL